MTLGNIDANGIGRYDDPHNTVGLSFADLLNEALASVSAAASGGFGSRINRRIIPTSVTNGSVNSSGLVSSSPQTLVRVRGAFPNTHTAFEVHFDVETTAAVGLLFRLAVDAADSTTGYDYERVSHVSTATTVIQDLNQSSGSLSPVGIIGRHVGTARFFTPNAGDETMWDASSVASANPMTTAAGRTQVGGLHRPTTQYNSLTLLASSGLVTVNRLTIVGIA